MVMTPGDSVLPCKLFDDGYLYSDQEMSTLMAEIDNQSSENSTVLGVIVSMQENTTEMRANTIII